MMERKDLVVLGEKTLKDLTSHPPENPESFLVRMTSGTSGDAPIVIATGYAPEAPVDVVGDAEVERAISCLGSLSARLSTVLVMNGIPPERVIQILLIDPQDLVPGLSEMLTDFRPENIYGFCSYIARLTNYVGPSVARGVRRIGLVGERLDSFFAQLFSERFSNAEQVEYYVANEVAGYIGRGVCRHLSRNHFHPVSGVTVEIDNPDADGTGDILVSKVVFRSVRVDRYRIGDIGRFVQKQCACGEVITFELLGRKGIDYIKLAGALIRREEFDRVAALFPGLIDDYRAEVREVSKDGKLQGEIIIHVFRRGGPPTEALLREMTEKFSRNVFLTPAKTLTDLVLEDLFTPLAIEFSKAPLAQGHKDVKLVQRFQ